MPSEYSSEHSRDDAADLARRTGLNFSDRAHRADGRRLPRAADPGGLELTGLAEENLQARVRGTTLMALSNRTGTSC